jgi:hypothetical protein
MYKFVWLEMVFLIVVDALYLQKFSLEALPARLKNRYLFMVKFVDLVRAKTPKVSLYLSIKGSKALVWTWFFHPFLGVPL